MNVIFITSDHHRWDYLSGQGGPAPTPNLDALAAGGCLLGNAYCQAPLCLPSRASMTTGRYPMNTGCFSNRHPVDPAAPTFLHCLRDAGVHTAMLGKLHHHVHCMDHDHATHQHEVHGWGFNEVQEVSGKRGSGAIQCECRFTAFLRRVGLYEAYREKSGRWGSTTFQAGITDPWPWDPDTTQDAFIRDMGCAFLREQKRGRPFYLHLGFVGPHPPFDAPESFRDGLPPVPPSVTKNPDWWPAYLACIREIDHHVGKVLEALDDCGLRGDTLVIYTSDHGDMAGDHGLWGKVHLREGSVHVPFIANGPGVEAGAVRSGLVELIDVGRTVCDAFGVSSHHYDQGRSLMPLLRGGRDHHRETVFAEMGSDKMLFDGRHKLIYGDLARDRRHQWQEAPHNGPAFGRPVNLAPDQCALFDLSEDPKEQNNLADDPRHADLFRSMERKLLHRLIANMQAVPENPASVM
jgi:arylsulfatase